mmetsp:Transcript_33849/g.95103  ORF Transcript_33849/g.95103 Transcript_33849/m.95103 type:complete len:568 (+) Transcript_33849:65-1768(+)|eukprot:CAMPEP_0179333400 /NCGR_PEP_ID=MMETSP0797-20121207/65290_1 /TAXON_ID=47934 /ORGANISM="Dinophysis acuminata, Strain DAEP01" /LENGTH=567 /DNA_ID=CAMNT_0021046419 /DNA_START=41 /DNA_END=1744 /DNA_ORIENTATION=+
MSVVPEAHATHIHPASAGLGLTKKQLVSDLGGGNDTQQCRQLFEIGSLGESWAAKLGYLPEVVKLLDEPSAQIKCAALGALGQMGEVAAPEGDKIANFLDDQDTAVVKAAITALGLIGPHAAEHAPAVAQFLTEPQVGLRTAAAEALGGMKASTYADELREALKDAEASVVVAALKAVAAWEEDGQTLAADVAACCAHASGAVRAAAVRALMKAGGAGERQAERVAELLPDCDNATLQAVVEYFESIGASGKKATEKIRGNLSSGNGRVQAASALALGYVKAGKFAKEVAALLTAPYKGDTSVALSAAGLEPKLPADIRRPACAAAKALAMMGDEGAAFADDIAKQIGGDTPAEATAEFVKALGLMGKPALGHTDKIISLLQETSALVREAACFAIGELAKAEETVDKATAVTAKLMDVNPSVRKAAVTAIGAMQAEGNPRDILGMFGDKVPAVQVAAVKAMGAIGERGQVFAAEVCRMAFDTELPVRVAAVTVLGDMDARGATFAEDVSALLDADDGAVREAALLALAKMGEEAKPFLASIKPLCSDPLEYVRAAADECHEALAAA